MIVKEYRPTFVDSDAPLQKGVVEHIDDALQLTWVKEKCGVEMISDLFVETKDGRIVAMVFQQAT